MTKVSSGLIQDIPTEGGFLALMRYHNYAILWSSQAISQLGTRLHWVAISLWVYSRTGSALAVSYVIMALMIAPALVGLFAGATIDRFDRRKILIYGDLLRSGLVFLIPELMSRGLLWVYLDLVVVSAASAFFRPAMFAAIPQSVPRGWLLKANAYYASLESGTEVLGPALGGILVAKLGYASGLYLDAMSYMVSAILVTALRLPPTVRPVTEEGPLSTFRLIREGLQYVRRDKIQVSLLAFLFAGQWVVGLSSLQTPLAKGVLGISDREFGWFQSVWGLGFVAASLLASVLARGIPRGQAVVLSYFLWAVATGVMGLSASYPMLIVTGFWVGFANILLFVNVGTLLMEYTPSDRIGRAITIRQVGVALVRVTALLGFGWLADRVDVRVSVVLMGTISAVGTAYATVRYRDLWQYQTEAAVEGATGWQPRTVLPVIPSPVRLAAILDSYGDKEFGIIEQRSMNAAALFIMCAAWLLLLLLSPIRALWVATVVAIAIVAGIALRRIGQRLRALTQGKE